MSEINFVEVDAAQIQADMIRQFEQVLGENLYPADERLMFLQQETQVVVGLKNLINDSARQNLLRYARGDVLDALGELYGDRGKRLSAQSAITTLKITLSVIQPSNYLIRAGKRVTPDGMLYYATSSDVTILAGQLTAEVKGIATEVGSQYNGYIAGQIKTMVDPIPYVLSIVNTDTSSGGTDIEGDDNYRERLRILPESLSTAGPEGAYIFWAKSADSTIIDVAVDSPSPCVVRIVPLLEEGGIPSQSILDAVLAITSAKDKRPLTDQVQVEAPTVVSYDIALTYYLDEKLSADEIKYRQAIEGEKLDVGVDSAVYEYISWQQSELGISVSPDMLRYFIQSAAQYQQSSITKTAVKRIALTSPVYADITSTQVAKVGTITVAYGGLE
ncbi:baseplate J/gp47 family protein [Desulfosporosinus fructosivorans]|uniref:Baseplate J/gp47 family protein n=1 Tax=Desulfosporosinus fructosivorans TaxID=2018669 RepID=A0A4Z0R3D7_9FIRM|nr:baseplate J/gp47 family protein [Desulfosporosinus fructosivorans]TGE36895.1 baseplate J/gp47 family protein [Desulfosporosinus fructosivorans]